MRASRVYEHDTVRSDHRRPSKAEAGKPAAASLSGAYCLRWGPLHSLTGHGLAGGSGPTLTRARFRRGISPGLASCCPPRHIPYHLLAAPISSPLPIASPTPTSPVSCSPVTAAAPCTGDTLHSSFAPCSYRATLLVRASRRRGLLWKDGASACLHPVLVRGLEGHAGVLWRLEPAPGVGATFQRCRIYGQGLCAHCRIGRKKKLAGKPPQMTSAPNTTPSPHNTRKLDATTRRRFSHAPGPRPFASMSVIREYRPCATQHLLSASRRSHVNRRAAADGRRWLCRQPR